MACVTCRKRQRLEREPYSSMASMASSPNQSECCYDATWPLSAQADSPTRSVTSRLTAEFRQWLVEERHINP